MQNLLSPFLFLPLPAFTQTDSPVFSAGNGIIKTVIRTEAGEGFAQRTDSKYAEIRRVPSDSRFPNLTESFPNFSALPYKPGNPVTIKVAGKEYIVKTERFENRDNEPGDFGVTGIFKDGRQVCPLRDADGIVRLDDPQNLYLRNFNGYSGNAHVIAVPLTDSSKSPIFPGQHYGTYLHELFTVVVTGRDIKPVYKEPLGIESPDRPGGGISIPVQSNITEPGAPMHTIGPKDRVLRLKDNQLSKK